MQTVIKSICLNCQTEFVNHGTRGVFCSRACYHAYRKKPNDRYHKVTYVTLTCDYCGKEFQRRNYEVGRAAKNFCSHSCAGKGSSINNIHAKKRPSITLICEHCGKPYTATVNRLRTSRFCSRVCSSAHRKLAFIGPNNPNFRHGLSQVSAKRIALTFYEPRCAICGWNTIIDVHHITKKIHGGTNEVDNLIVLCPNHHKMAERDMISKEQLYDAQQSNRLTQPDK